MPDEANEAPKPFQAIPEQPGSTVPETQARGGLQAFWKRVTQRKAGRQASEGKYGDALKTLAASESQQLDKPGANNDAIVGESAEETPHLTSDEKYVKDLINFWKTLLLQEQYGVTPRPDMPTTVLALGSGRFIEGYALEAFLGGVPLNKHTSNVDLTAVDIDPRLISDAQATQTIIDPNRPGQRMPLPNYHYVVGDATHLESQPDVPEQADVVFIGHQQISEYSDVRKGTWRAIVAGGLQRLRDDSSRMIITSYNEGEHQEMLRALEGLNCEILVADLVNPNTRPAIDGQPSSEAAVHGRIAIIKRKPPQLAK